VVSKIGSSRTGNNRINNDATMATTAARVRVTSGHKSIVGVANHRMSIKARASTTAAQTSDHLTKIEDKFFKFQ